MVLVIEIFRFLLCCLEQEEEEEYSVGYGYQRVPDFIQPPNTRTNTVFSNSGPNSSYLPPHYYTPPRYNNNSSSTPVVHHNYTFTNPHTPVVQSVSTSTNPPRTPVIQSNSTSTKPQGKKPSASSHGISQPSAPPKDRGNPVPSAAATSQPKNTQVPIPPPASVKPRPSSSLGSCQSSSTNPQTPVVHLNFTFTKPHTPVVPSISTSTNPLRTPVIQSIFTPVIQSNSTSTKPQDKKPQLTTPFASSRVTSQPSAPPKDRGNPVSYSAPSQPSVPPKNPQVPIPPPASVKPRPLSSLGSCESSSSSLQSIPNKGKYAWVERGTSSFLYSAPEDIKGLLENDIVPQVLQKRLTSSTYDKYFAALLYAEDIYIEKWSDYCLHSVTLELHKAAIYARSNKNKNLIVNEKEDDKHFVAFRIDSIPERRPFLLSRDFVLLHPLEKTAEPFRGILYRVVKGNLVLAEFGDDFHRQHSSSRKYDVSFSFNRVCLKRCHQAVAAAADPLFQSFLFPDQKSRIIWLDHSPRVMPSHRNLNKRQLSAVNIISRLKVSPPFLVEGPLSVVSTSKQLTSKQLSETGMVIRESVLQILRTWNDCRILINAPTNSLCDVLMRSLKTEIPESEMFRANAAFRELDGVPYDILPLCPFKGECFTCPPIRELRKFKVVLSTFVSSYRLQREGITAGHFSHIFLVDASSTTEPEAMVPLANLADEKTVVVVSGATGNSSGWVRSEIARRCGLKISYFQRLLESEPYCSLDSEFVACIKETGPDLNAINSTWKRSGNRNGY